MPAVPSAMLVATSACPACAEPLAKDAERCAACGEVLVHRAPAEHVATTPSLAERVRGVLLEPAATFRAHEARWGWFQPWLLVVLCGVAVGLLRLARVDVGAFTAHAVERQLDRMPSGQRRQMAQNPGAAEGLETGKRMAVFGAKLASVVWPPLGGLLGLIMTSGLVFVLCLAMRDLGKGVKPDLAQAVSIAAHVELVELIRIGATGLGTLTGNPMALTSPAGFADQLDRPVLHAVLARLDPVLWLWWAVLAIALASACRLPWRRAVVLCFGGWSLVSLLAAAAAGASAAMSGGGS